MADFNGLCHLTDGKSTSERTLAEERLTGQSWAPLLDFITHHFLHHRPFSHRDSASAADRASIHESQ